MSKKTLNKADLGTLGAEKLAELVTDLVQGSAALQRRARMELSAAQSQADVAADIRNRFAFSLRRGTQAETRTKVWLLATGREVSWRVSSTSSGAQQERPCSLKSIGTKTCPMELTSVPVLKGPSRLWL